MNRQERASRLEQVDRELTRTLEDMKRTAAVWEAHPAHHMGVILQEELTRFTRQLESTRDYLREVVG